jgi:hypothetical protein
MGGKVAESVRIFLSAVSDEFRAYCDQLRTPTRAGSSGRFPYGNDHATGGEAASLQGEKQN